MPPVLAHWWVALIALRGPRMGPPPRGLMREGSVLLSLRLPRGWHVEPPLPIPPPVAVCTPPRGVALTESRSLPSRNIMCTQQVCVYSLATTRSDCLHPNHRGNDYDLSPRNTIACDFPFPPHITLTPAPHACL